MGSVLDGRWQLLGVLGSGGMATVYEAEHRNGKRAAVKVLHPELAADSVIVQRFLREGLAANAVQHPGVVSVMDDGRTPEGLPYLVMEHLEGESLDALLERIECPIKLADALVICIAALDVLEKAHQNGIIHRDLKPDNLFLCTDGQVKVLDFGIARLLDTPGMSLTQSGIAMGTPTFMPREQAQGDPTRLDGRADLWSLGATLFFALTFRYLFDASTPVAFLAQLVTKEPPSFAEVKPPLPPGLVSVLDRALQHDLNRRWSSARAMKDALLEAVARAGISLPPRPSPYGFVASDRPKISLRERLQSFPDEAPPSVSPTLQAPQADFQAPRATSRNLVLGVGAGLGLLGLLGLLALRSELRTEAEQPSAVPSGGAPSQEASPEPSASTAAASVSATPAVPPPTQPSALARKGTAAQKIEPRTPVKGAPPGIPRGVDLGENRH